MRFAGSALQQLSAIGTPDYSGIGATAIEGAGRARIANHEAEAQVHGYGLKSIADVAAAEKMAEAEMAIGRTQGNAAMMQGLFDGIGSLAGGAIQGGSGLGNTGNTIYTGQNGAGQGQLLAPLSTGKNASSKLDSFLSGSHMVP